MFPNVPKCPFIPKWGQLSPLSAIRSVTVTQTKTWGQINPNPNLGTNGDKRGQMGTKGDKRGQKGTKGDKRGQKGQKGTKGTKGDKRGQKPQGTPCTAAANRSRIANHNFVTPHGSPQQTMPSCKYVQAPSDILENGNSIICGAKSPKRGIKAQS